MTVANKETKLQMLHKLTAPMCQDFPQQEVTETEDQVASDRLVCEPVAARTKPVINPEMRDLIIQIVKAEVQLALKSIRSST
jgi:hypothetical protein